ncbi:MAG: hypothetical protein AAGM22_15440 [Acidobacteriota bacterium]
MSTPTWISKKALAATALLVLAALGFGLVAVYGIKSANPVRAKKTASDMRQLNAVLKAAQIPTADPDSLRALAADTAFPIALEDGWGNPFVVTVSAEDPGALTYTVRSLGQDGLEGPCCERWINGWENDALLVDGAWVQFWNN